MIEVIPNWHPFFVHFTIALFISSILFFIVRRFVEDSPNADRLAVVAYWNLWLGFVFTIGTVGAGIYAYNTVDHDTPSHLAMTDHRNWALATFAVFLVATGLSVISKHKFARPTLPFLLVLLTGGGLLLTTGFKGAEVVYRHGLGVMSLPKTSGEGHAHEHADGQAHDHGKQKNVSDSEHRHTDSIMMPMDSTGSSDDGHNHQH